MITDDVVRQDEVARWMEVLAAVTHKLHIRKPKASREELRNLLKEVPVEWRKKLVIHYQPQLAEEFDLGGLHVSYKDFDKYSGFKIPVSCSVHNWDEARKMIDTCAYCFISPVFDSISKRGYHANDELMQVPAELRGKKIYALGGIDTENAPLALRNGYYGLVALGYVWNENGNESEKVKALLESISKERVIV